MNTEIKNNQSNYYVPLELFADILRILLKSKIPYQIEGVKSRMNVILLSVKYRQDKLHLNAKENIESLIDNFGHYMSGLSETVLYSEDEL